MEYERIIYSLLSMQVEIIRMPFFHQSTESYYLGLEMRPGAEILSNTSARARSVLFEAAPADDCLIFWYNHERDVSHIGNIFYLKKLMEKRMKLRLRRGCS